jgi:hypothetical protein
MNETPYALPRAVIPYKNISGIAIEADEAGNARYGLIEELPFGVEVRVIGDGFSDRTVRVQYNGRSYFAFFQDIEEPDSSC